MSNAAIMAERANSFQQSWNFTRSLSLDLLDSLDDESLLFSPGANLGDFWKQFRHLGRVQENYVDALRTQKLVFGPQGCHYSGDVSKASLVTYLQTLDHQLQHELHNLNWEDRIDWFGEQVDVFEHLSRMVGHENLHHGQFIVYMRLLDRKFPHSWNVFGL